MKTTGSFGEVYLAARDIWQCDENSPHDPVIRREGDKWMLDSGIDPAPDADLEIDLDSFYTFFDSYYHTEHIPSESCIRFFVEHVQRGSL